MTLNDLAIGSLILIGVTFSFSAFRLGLKIFTADAEEYRRNKEAIPSLSEAVLGKLRTFYTGGRDHRISAGLAFDTRRQKWVEQGVLSESAIDSILR
jgi:hypothetical protein